MKRSLKWVMFILMLIVGAIVAIAFVSSDLFSDLTGETTTIPTYSIRDGTPTGDITFPALVPLVLLVGILVIIMSLLIRRGGQGSPADGEDTNAAPSDDPRATEQGVDRRTGEVPVPPKGRGRLAGCIPAFNTRNVVAVLIIAFGALLVCGAIGIFLASSVIDDLEKKIPTNEVSPPQVQPTTVQEIAPSLTPTLQISPSPVVPTPTSAAPAVEITVTPQPPSATSIPEASPTYDWSGSNDQPASG